MELEAPLILTFSVSNEFFNFSYIYGLGIAERRAAEVVFEW